MKKSIFYFLALAMVLSAVPAFADDTQDALNKAGFGANQGATNVVDPNAPGGTRYSDQAATPAPANSGYDVGAGLDYKHHTYMNFGDLKYGFKVADNEVPLPKPESVQRYDYYPRFDLVIGQTVIGRSPSASDPLTTWPSEPFGDPYYYSGDQWGDCLGPNCIHRGQFRQPVGSWVHFTHTRVEERNNLVGLLGFPDTIQQISNSVGQPVVELRNGRE
jgi:hypothetical protein